MCGCGDRAMRECEILGLWFVAGGRTGFTPVEHFDRSGSTGAELVDVDVDPCKGAPQGCELKHGTRPVITITFKPSMFARSKT